MFKLKFSDLLDKYESELQYVDRMLKEQEEKSYGRGSSYWQGYRTGIFEWFEEMKNYCRDFHPRIYNPKKQDCRKFTYVEESHKGYNKEYKLDGILKYRGEEIPIYRDVENDRIFVVYQKHRIDSRVYIFSDEAFFCREIDAIKDKIVS